MRGAAREKRGSEPWNTICPSRRWRAATISRAFTSSNPPFPRWRTTASRFLNLTLSDRTGAVDAKVWDYPGPIGAADEGKVVKIRGSVSEFRGALQVTVERIRLAGEDDRYDVTALVPTAPIDGEAMYASVGSAARLHHGRRL
ncbi:MAG: OB-fold nucleic acid binding domain-containing protein [Oscillospiraceae bacterium]